MNLPDDLRSLSWTARRAKGRFQMGRNRVKNAQHQVKEAKSRRGGSKGSDMEPISESAPTPEPAPASGSVPAPAPASGSTPAPAPASGSAPGPMVRSLSEPISGPVPDQGDKPGVLLPVVAGVLGAVVAALLSLVIADNADDRLLLVLIGVPLGAILTVGVVFAYRSAGLIDR